MKTKEIIKPTNINIIHCDLDGVLVDFVAGVNAMFAEYGIDDYSESKYERDKKYRSLMWKTVSRYQKDHGDTFWLNMPMMSDAEELLNYIQQYSTEILSATGTPGYHADVQKRKWVKEHIGDMKVELVRTAADKAKFAAEGHILIDDKRKAIDPWKEAGGIGILHTSAENTIRQLKKLGL